VAVELGGVRLVAHLGNRCSTACLVVPSAWPGRFFEATPGDHPWPSPVFSAAHPLEFFRRFFLVGLAELLQEQVRAVEFRGDHPRRGSSAGQAREGGVDRLHAGGQPCMWRGWPQNRVANRVANCRNLRAPTSTHQHVTKPYKPNSTPT